MTSATEDNIITSASFNSLAQLHYLLSLTTFVWWFPRWQYLIVYNLQHWNRVNSWRHKSSSTTGWNGLFNWRHHTPLMILTKSRIDIVSKLHSVYLCVPITNLISHMLVGGFAGAFNESFVSSSSEQTIIFKGKMN